MVCFHAREQSCLFGLSLWLQQFKLLKPNAIVLAKRKVRGCCMGDGSNYVGTITYSFPTSTRIVSEHYDKNLLHKKWWVPLKLIFGKNRKYEGHPENKRLSTQFAQLFCCSRSLVSGIQCDFEKSCLLQLYVGPCHVVSAEIAVATLCRLRIPQTVRCEVLFAFCRRKILDKLSREIVLLHDNACSHTARQTQALLREQFHWDIFEHPSYSPDLAPSDFFLSLKMKEHIASKRSANDEDLKDAVVT